MRLKRRWIGGLNSSGVPVDDNKKQRLQGEMMGQVTCGFNQFDANARILRGLLNGPEQRLWFAKERSVRSIGHKNCMEAIIEQSGLMHPSDNACIRALQTL